MFPQGSIASVTPFVRAMPDRFKHDTSIDTFTAYKWYIASKPWVRDNYLRMPDRNRVGFNNMALSQSVNDSLDEAESNLRNALAYAARQEKPFVCNIIAEMITKIDSMKQMDNIMDKRKS